MFKKFDKIVLNIPHCSITMLNGQWNGDDINNGINKWTDHFVDSLFIPNEYKKEGIEYVIGKLNRFSCDYERLENDTTNGLGNGIIYKQYQDSVRIISEKEEIEILINHYYPYIENLKSKLTPNTLLIDCHSFPSEVVNNIDVCIGFNEDWSKPDEDIINTVVNHFKDMGYKVGINFPYSNSISPKCDFEYKSIMIEVNKKLYMDEELIIPRVDMYKLQQKITSLYDKLLNR